MLQDIAPQKLFNEYDPNAVPAADSIVFCFRRRGSFPEMLSTLQDGRIHFPLWEEISGTAAPAVTEEEVQYLFRIDDTSFFLLKEQSEEGRIVPGKTPGFENYTYETLRTLRKSRKGMRELMFAAFTAFHLAGWYRDNQFCGTCGAPTRHHSGERALECTACGRRIYPRIQPAVIVGVTDGDRIVLTRYANRPFYNYSMIAGFTEIGETLEETVAREVMEETGLKVRNIRYYKSQPWGIADDILAGFYCDVDGDRTIRVDTSELKEARWFTREEVILQEDDYSLTGHMMNMFKEGKEPH